MARKREFNETQALSDALTLFWKKGLINTSVDELVAATKVQRYGLYGVFGGKKKFFLKALDLYEREVMGTMLSELEKPDAALEQIDGFFGKYESLVDQPISGLGCLMCFTATEAALSDSVVRRKTKQCFSRIEGLFEQALTRALARGEVTRNVDIAATAKFFVGALIGSASLGRSSVNRDVVRAFVQGVREYAAHLELFHNP